nr:PQQ-binding-like beta-propeller repeat protein [Candidatus Sigynarchaeota archaeon]
MAKSKWNPGAFGYWFKVPIDPYPDDAPWPCMRHDTRNAGSVRDLSWKPLDGTTTEIHHFRTGNAIFSTPVIDAKDRIYVGSADKTFYAFDLHAGRELWHVTLEGIIDSAACIGKDGTIYVAAGDGQVHAYTPDGQEKWHYDAVHGRPKHQFSFSSNFWYEANIVFGPDGALYVNNDDFFTYKMTPDSGEIIWGFRTGFLLWSACAFGQDGTVYVPGFDHVFYALDPNTGKKKWSINLHGSMVSSPAIGNDDTIFQGSFNGNVYAIDPTQKKVKWTFSTGAHIYASPAIGPDNDVIYIGSTNGTLYAIEAASGKIRWTFYTGDTIRASASIGPDPEKLAPYLLYLGGGDGRVYAIDPDGRLRWSYDTLVKAKNKDYPNINASIALGHSGIAVASSTGDIIWIPYDCLLPWKEGQETPNEVEGVKWGSVLDSPQTGPCWHYITPGGKLSETPIINDAQEILPVNTISLRLLLHGGIGAIPARLDPGSIRITTSPVFKHRFEIQSNMSTINIIPEEILAPGTAYTISISTSYEWIDRGTFDHSVDLPFKTRDASNKSPLSGKEDRVFIIIHIAIPQPSIIPSLNQIGFASLEIPFTIIDVDENKKRFIAWGVQKFGDEGVPQKRVTIYAFSGSYDGDYFMMDSRKCLFEITSFNIPLDLFRIAGVMEPDGSASQGGSLIVEKHWGTHMLKILGEMGSTSPITSKMMFAHLKSVGIVQFFKALGPFFTALLRQVQGETWKTWGLINHRDQLLGAGTFNIKPGSSEKEVFLKDVRVCSFAVDNKKREIVAEVEGVPKIGAWDPVVHIILADKDTMDVIPINYSKNNAQSSREGKIRVILSIPKDALVGHANVRAYLLASLYLVKTIDF